jgi:hypothetical protein
MENYALSRDPQTWLHPAFQGGQLSCTAAVNTDQEKITLYADTLRRDFTSCSFTQKSKVVSSLVQQLSVQISRGKSQLKTIKAGAA